MALAITTNVASLNAQRQLLKSTNAMGTTFQRLSSGLRINSAKDDAAGLSISTRMTAQVRGLNQAARNANDAVSMVQVADGALEETTNALQRIRELAVQAANDTLVSGDRKDIQKEVNQLMSEIDRIAANTQFNDQYLLSGGFSAKKFHVGEDKDQTLQVSILRADTASLFNVTTILVSNQQSAEATITRIDNALNSVSDIRATLGSYQNRLESIINNLANVSENTTAARSRIIDADIAAETAALTRNAILQQAGTAILAQANQQPQIALKLLG
ncbi:MAG: flagellin FliC [Magnetococcales bacterium]|nr:flagellin FliC [Magnetococcales bacterium]MBF0155655.1 flagellin FliC [Magnetococcales bacterium]